MSEAVAEATRRNSDARPHLPELDGIRGIAITAVLLTHAATAFPQYRFSGPSRYIREVITSGWGGVDLFFVLSGFLITGILLATKGTNNYFRSFYMRRCLRIWPLYYGWLAVLFLAGRESAWVRSLSPHRWTGWLTYLLYLQNVPWMFPLGSLSRMLGHFWSLAVEEQFYLVWPLFVLYFSEKALLRICAGAFVLALPLRIYLVNRYPLDFHAMAITTSRVDGLVLGAAIAIFMARWKRPVPLRWISAAGATGLTILLYIAIYHRVELFATIVFMPTIGITAFALLSAALVALSQHRLGPLQRLLTTRWLTIFGKYSYGMYVYHFPLYLVMGFVASHWLGIKPPPRTSIALLLTLLQMGATFVVAKLSYDLVESRFLRLKRYFSPTLRKPVPLAVETPVEATGRR